MILDKITAETRIWTSNSDIVLPIDEKNIPQFKQWINWNGFSKTHTGYDFAAYLANNHNCILGLSEDTPVRAIADGIVAQISQGLAEGYPYATFINVEHAEEGSGLFSSYHLDFAT